MKIVFFALFIVVAVGSIAKELNTTPSFEGIQTQSVYTEEKKTVRDGNSGSCGNLSWVFNNKTSIITISGQGDMSCCNLFHLHGQIFQIKCRAL